ncbi:MAG TPA: hypothetical protein VF253_06250 [Candidatus Limnocylindrales bacterium]
MSGPTVPDEPPLEPGRETTETPASPVTPAIDDDRVAVLAAYFRSNQGRFTDDALARKAEEAAYTPAEIRAARSLAQDRGPADRGAPGSRTNRGVVAAVAIAYVVILYLLISGTAAISSDLSGTVGLVGLLAGIVAWALLRNERPSLAQGIGCGVVLAVSIPLVVVIAIIGICVVAGTYPLGG